MGDDSDDDDEHVSSDVAAGCRVCRLKSAIAVASVATTAATAAAASTTTTMTAAVAASVGRKAAAAAMATMTTSEHALSVEKSGERRAHNITRAGGHLAHARSTKRRSRALSYLLLLLLSTHFKDKAASSNKVSGLSSVTSNYFHLL